MFHWGERPHFMHPCIHALSGFRYFAFTNVSVNSLVHVFVHTSNHFGGRSMCLCVSIRLVCTSSLLQYNRYVQKNNLCFEHTDSAMSGGQADVQQEIWNVEYSTSQYKRLVEKIEYNYQSRGRREKRNGPWP